MQLTTNILLVAQLQSVEPITIVEDGLEYTIILGDYYKGYDSVMIIDNNDNKILLLNELVEFLLNCTPSQFSFTLQEFHYDVNVEVGENTIYYDVSLNDGDQLLNLFEAG